MYGSVPLRSFMTRPARVESENEVEQWQVVNTTIPVVCSIFGVIIFMRLASVVGDGGFLPAFAVISLAFIITLLTVGSLSALASDIPDSSEERVDGLFNALRYSLDEQIGQMIGGMLCVSFGVGIGYYLLGFSEISMYYFGVRLPHSAALPWNPDGSWNTVLLASILLAALTVSYVAGVKISRTALRFVFVMVLIAVCSNLLLLLIPNRVTNTGFDIDVLRSNMLHGSAESYVKMFSSFFPAFCGVIGGANLAESVMKRPSSWAITTSGVVPDSAAQLVLGIHHGLLFSFLVYVLLGFVLASCVNQEALSSNNFIVEKIVDSIIGVPVIYFGIACTTLSSALSNIMGVASVLMALFSPKTVRPAPSFSTPQDINSMSNNILSTSSVSEETDGSRSSKSVLFWTWAMGQAAVLSGTVDAIIPIVSATFLLTFFVLNFACFFQEIASPSFNPFFKLYSKYTALLGCILSLGAFFLIVQAVFVALAGFFLLGFVVYHRHNIHSMLEQLRVVGSVRQPSRGRSRRCNLTNEEMILSPLGFSTLVSPRAEDSDEEVEVANKTRLKWAAVYVRDAIHGRFLGKQYLLEGLHKTEFKRAYHGLRFVRTANLSVLFLLTFFETPSWCYFLPSCGSPEKVLTWNLPMLAPSTSTLIELICLTLLAVEMGMKYTYMGYRLYFVNKWHSLQMLVIFADFIAVVVATTVPVQTEESVHKGNASPPMVLAPLIRPLILLSMSHRLRSGFSSLLRAMPRFTDGLLTLGALIALYAVCGMVLFEGTEEGKLYFSNFEDACLNLLILMTTANFPDVMLPIYNEWRSASIFFVSFLAIALFLVMNLVFASVYQSYRQEIRQRALEYSNNRYQSLEVAFKLLPEKNISDSEEDDAQNQEKVISKATYEKLLSELMRPTFSIFTAPSKRKNTRSSRRQNFSVLGHDDDEESQSISFVQFVSMIRSFASRQQARSRRKRKMKPSKENPHRVVNAIKAFLEGGRFEHVIDGIILGNLVAILFEVQAKIDDNATGGDSFVSWERYMPIFTAFYLVEMLLKMYVRGVGRYFDRPKNVYDCVVTLVITVAEISVHAHYSSAAEWTWARALLLLRFLRCLRLLVALHSLNSMFAIVVRLLPAFTTLYGMLGIIVTMYAVVGIQLFGGKLTKGDPTLEALSYGQNNYYSINFNDFASALTTLFSLLVVNNWFLPMHAAVAVTNRWNRLYFVSFYIVGVVMVLNLVVAFVVEAYFEEVSAVESSARKRMQSSESNGNLAGMSNQKEEDEPATPKKRRRKSFTAMSMNEDNDEDETQQAQHILRKRSSMAMRPRGDSIYIEDYL